MELQLNNERETQKISQSSFYKERRSQIAAEKSLGNEQNSWLFFFWVLSEKQLWTKNGDKAIWEKKSFDEWLDQKHDM